MSKYRLIRDFLDAHAALAPYTEENAVFVGAAIAATLLTTTPRLFDEGNHQDCELAGSLECLENLAYEVSCLNEDEYRDADATALGELMFNLQEIHDRLGFLIGREA